MFAMMSAIKRAVTSSRKWTLVAAGAACVAVPAFSQAADFNRGGPGRGGYDHGGYDHRDDRHDDHHDGGGFNFDIRIGSRQPDYEVRETRVWVPAEYRTVTERRWVEPVYRTETERVWVPDRYEEREVRDGPRGWFHTERVLVERAHYETREHQVCVSEGHWENCDRQELVREGHYEVRTERVRKDYRLSPFQVVNPAFAGIGFAFGK
jgi:hypothetical protein